MYLDEYEAAHKKLKLCEETSDVPTDLDQEITEGRRKRPTRRLFESDSCDSDDDNHTQSLLPRPPRIGRPPDRNKTGNNAKHLSILCSYCN